MRFIRSFLTVAAVAVFAATATAASSPLPAKPADYVLDEAGVFSADERRALSEELAQFERDTSNQIVVAVMPRVPDDYVMEDFTQRTAEAWGAGQKERENGIILFVFPEQREMRIEVGYGLEGAVPDALANQIIQDEIVPSFRAGDMPDGIARGVRALMAATKGEYTGTGRTVAEDEISGEAMINMIILIIFVIFVVISIRRSQARGGHVYDPSGRRDVWFPSSGSGLGGGGFSGGSGGSFGGGGFSGGGGGFGGGGASGRW